MIEVSAPGKLMLSGEWSVLEVDIPCIVLAVDERVYCKIEKSDEIELDAPDVGLKNLKGKFDGQKLIWENELTQSEKDRAILPEKAIEISLRYLHDIKKKLINFKITTRSDISQVILEDGTTTKIGFGSSAAAVVAIVAAILKLHGVRITKEEEKDRIYKLATIAHYVGQGKVGSAFDIAASTYGGAVIYRRFNPDWLIKEMDSGKGLNQIIDAKWRAFSAENILLPKDFILCVGWTKTGASTKELVTKIQEFKKTNEKEYWRLINSIKNVTEKLILAIKKNNKKEILNMIDKNRTYLKELSDISGSRLETEELTKLIENAKKFEAAGKFSGAGGGDCGIAVCFDHDTANKIKNAWKAAGLYPINVEISKTGLREE